MPAPHHLIFTGWMLFLTPNKQCQSTEDKKLPLKLKKIQLNVTRSVQILPENPER